MSEQNPTDDEPKVIPELPPLAAHERGPSGLKSLSLADGDGESVDLSALNTVRARLWKGTPFAQAQLALECLAGPYKGVTFSFSSFEVMPTTMENNLRPVKFETTIHVAPNGFVKDEAFDLYCSEVLLSWLHYIATNDIQSMVRMDTTDGIH